MACNHISYRSYHFGEARGELRGQAIALHRQRYQEIGFMPKDFQDPYEPDSTYFVARAEATQHVVGVCRLVMQRLETLPTYAHFELFAQERRALTQLEPGTYTELGAFTKLPHHPDLVPGLLMAAQVYASEHGVTHQLCCIDQRFFDAVRTFLDLPLRIIGQPRMFHGSIKIPCVVRISECLEQLKARRPQLFSRHDLPLEGQPGATPPVGGPARYTAPALVSSAPH